jgi:hypothetical protein
MDRRKLRDSIVDEVDNAFNVTAGLTIAPGEAVDALEDLAAELLERADEIRASLNAPAEGDADAVEAEDG